MEKRVFNAFINEQDSPYINKELITKQFNQGFNLSHPLSVVKTGVNAITTGYTGHKRGTPEYVAIQELHVDWLMFCKTLHLLTGE
jgi:hypothetical protein